MTRLPSAYAVHAPAVSAQTRAAGCLDSCDLVRRNDLPHHQVRRHATAQLRDLLLSPGRPGLATGSVATLACYLSLRLPLRPDSGYPIEPITAVMLVIGWLIGNSVHQARVHAEQLRAQAATQAVTGERLRIARELHEMVAHSTGIVALQAGAARRIIDTYRIIQEAVTNVVRHADTRACQVTVDCRADELSIEVVDAGRGHGTTTGRRTPSSGSGSP
jgi:signal transduction histidine kinase